MSILIADSGSTKTQWRLITELGSEDFYTIGINPYVLSKEVIEQIIYNELPPFNSETVSAVHYYGAGISGEEQELFLKEILSRRFVNAELLVASDMIGAARALCGTEPGVCGILGTGSNSCFYDGLEVHFNIPSLGFILGDEGAGTHLGKKVIKHYYYQTFDQDLSLAFEQKFGKNLNELLTSIYKGPSPNRYLASYATFLKEHRGHYMIENIIEDCFVAFHEKHILKYREVWQYPIHFIGGIANEFKDVLEALHLEYGLTTGKILKSPMDGLVEYHTKQKMMS